MAERWYVPCGCASHGDHLGCGDGCRAQGCVHPYGQEVSAATEEEADRRSGQPVETEPDEYDVAVVVYCRAQGVDEGDAQNRAERALLNDVLIGEPPHQAFPIKLPGGVKVAGFSGLSYAHVALRPTATPYKHAGMSAPRKAADGG